MSKHRKVRLNTDPSGIHYSTHGVDYDGCFECSEPWPCEVEQVTAERNMWEARAKHFGEWIARIKKVVADD